MSGPAKRDSRARVQRARDKRLAEIKAAQARRERARKVRLALAGTLAVLLVVGLLVVVRVVSGGGGSKSTGAASSPASAATVADVTGVPAATLDTIGAGTAQAYPRRLDAPALTADGKPKVLYVGGEFCPFCAAQRWAVVVALSRFGTWSNLGQTHSASQDVFPDTATLSFHGASFTSQYLSFTGVETVSNQPLADGSGYKSLDKLSAADQKIMDQYDVQKYTGGSDGGIPFLDFGGRYVMSGASYSPQLLAGKTQEQIAAALKDPNSDIAKAINGSANVLTAAICQITENQPAQVCSSAGVTAAAKKLPTS